MLYAASALEQRDLQVLDDVHRRRQLLAEALAEQQPWNDSVRRLMRSRVLQAATGIGEIPAPAPDVDGYGAAIARIESVLESRVVSVRPGDGWSRLYRWWPGSSAGADRNRDRVGVLDHALLSALHHDVCRHLSAEAHAAESQAPQSHAPESRAPESRAQRANANESAAAEPEALPGLLLRSGAVTPSPFGLAAYDHPGAPVDQLDDIVEELIEGIDGAEDAVLAGAMAHLNIRLAQPYPQGNRRLGLVVNTLVLGARPAGQLAIPALFAGIEEAIARTSRDVEEVVASLAGSGWEPHRDATMWLRLCLRSHALQGQVLLQRCWEAEQAWYKAVALANSEIEAQILLEASLGHELSVPMLLAATGSPLAEVEAGLDALEARGLLMCVASERSRTCMPGMTLQNFRSTLADHRPSVNDPYPHLRDAIRGSRH